MGGHEQILTFKKSNSNIPSRPAIPEGGGVIGVDGGDFLGNFILIYFFDTFSFFIFLFFFLFFLFFRSYLQLQISYVNIGE